MANSWREKAEHFLEHETEFHLGFLPTEQSNLLTRGLGEAFAFSTREGVQLLSAADRAIVPTVCRILKSEAFRQFCQDAQNCVRGGGRIVFSGCGATGRLSILLESMWKRAFPEQWNQSVLSIMTGGDYALVKSVESFEDVQAFGRRQVAELAMKEGDMLVAITEGGETSSVIGTVHEAADRGCRVWLLFNNPAELLRTHLVRCREVLEDKRVRVLDLFCGPMALAGSTRMQATTSEQLIAGAMLEHLGAALTGSGEVVDFGKAFAQLMDFLDSEKVVAPLVSAIEMEYHTYRAGGRITYFAEEYLLDIFTDTTERSPTFMLPGFRGASDRSAPPPWAFLKHPSLEVDATWQEMLGREVRCLEWTQEDYRAMNAPETVRNKIPQIGRAALMDFAIGCADCPERHDRPADAAVEIAFDRRSGFAEAAARKYLNFHTMEIPLPEDGSKLNLIGHLSVKLFLNDLSTGTMAKMGRVAGNWMSYVAVSNKKLVDRAIRLIAELGAMSYQEACFALFEGIDEIDRGDWRDCERPSAVQYVLKKCARRNP
ncbi:MAG: hypothetical protein PHS41_01640 [Victivallaceae bacterium]|nr:hypothetical protein [Victivallaceae bacterium]